MKAQERGSGTDMNMKIICLSLVMGICLIGLPSQATIHVITSDSLPYVVTSDYSGDTVRIAGTKISSPGNGITLENAATNILFDFGIDTLEFGTSYGDFYYGFATQRSSNYGIVVRGGTILHGVQNCGINGTDTAFDCSVFQLKAVGGIFLDNVTAIISGFDGSVMLGGYYAGYKNVEVRGGTFRHEGCGYTDRNWGAEVFRLTNPIDLSGSEFHFKATGIHVEGAIHGIFTNSGLQFINGCTLTIDARNDLYRYGPGEVEKPNATTVGPGGSFIHGTTNAYAIAGGYYAGSEISNNVIYTDSVHEGADGGMILAGVSGDPNAGRDTVKIHHNKFYLHRGLDSHYGYMNCKGFKTKLGGNRITHIYENEFHITVDTDSTELGGNNFRGRAGIGYDSEGADLDSALLIYNNLWEIRNVSGSGEAWGVGFRIEGDDELVPNASNEWFGNTIEACYTIYQPGGWAPYGRNFLIVGDTVRKANTAVNFRTFNQLSAGAYNNVFRDVHYENVDDTDMFWLGGGSNSEIVLQRTVKVFVMGNNSQPIENASVSVWNNYNQEVITGTTNACGYVTGVVTYWLESYGQDLTNYNDFRVRARLGSDSVISTNFTVGASAAGGRDTVTLQSTSGSDPGGTTCEELSNLMPSAPFPLSPSSNETITTLTPILLVSNSTDPENDPLTYNFEIYDASRTALLSSVNSYPEGAGTTGWRVPGGTLVDKNSYSWRARSHDGLVYSSWSTWSDFSVVLLGSGNSDTIPPSPVFIYSYPNPVDFGSDEILTFDLPDHPVDLLITTVAGYEVISANDVSGEYIWDGKNASGNSVSAGVYLWYISGTSQKGKIVVQGSSAR